MGEAPRRSLQCAHGGDHATSCRSTEWVMEWVLEGGGSSSSATSQHQPLAVGQSLTRGVAVTHYPPALPRGAVRGKPAAAAGSARGVPPLLCGGALWLVALGLGILLGHATAAYIQPCPASLRRANERGPARAAQRPHASPQHAPCGAGLHACASSCGELYGRCGACPCQLAAASTRHATTRTACRTNAPPQPLSWLLRRCPHTSSPCMHACVCVRVCLARRLHQAAQVPGQQPGRVPAEPQLPAPAPHARHARHGRARLHVRAGAAGRGRSTL